MAIVQISRITQRKGLQENLPQLAGAEFGWSVDARRLFIGNGTLEEGAPIIGNTEILTEFSDILGFQTTYTYKGEAAGYVVQTGPTASQPVTQSLQSWLDQFASVKDFGATGDGVTDDTDAINRALFQLFCREVNPQIRRSLFFPAGVYKVSRTIIIPPYATLYGEGADNSVIQLTNSSEDSASRLYVARTGDSLQQTGVNIGNNGATPPGDVTILDIGFSTLDPESSCFLVEDATHVVIMRSDFYGPLTTSDITVEADGIAGVKFSSTPSLICTDIIIDQCTYSGLTFGVATEDATKGVTISNSTFSYLYKGVVLGAVAPVNGGPTGVRIMQNVFDHIYAEGVEFGDIELNLTANNIFYDVGNHLQGTTNPATAVITFGASNNVSMSDMFERVPPYTSVYKRVELNGYQCATLINGNLFEMGPHGTQAAVSQVLTNNVSNQPLPGTALSITRAKAFTMTYTITRNDLYRTGELYVVATGAGVLSSDDSYTQNGDVGVTLVVGQTGTSYGVGYTTTNTGVDGEITYQITYQID